MFQGRPGLNGIKGEKGEAGAGAGYSYPVRAKDFRSIFTLQLGEFNQFLSFLRVPQVHRDPLDLQDLKDIPLTESK